MSFSVHRWCWRVPVPNCGILAAILLISSYGTAQAGKSETPGALNNPAVPEAIRQVLAPKGYRILPDINSPAIQVWYRKEVPAQPKNASADAIYDRLAESTLLGVIYFSKPAQDYRDQTVPAGFYTLRYGLMPNDGNHLGVAPSRDFALLVKVADDPGPDVQPKFAELVALSRKATGTNHPGPMNLVQPESDAAPAIIKDDQEHWIFVDKLKMKTGEPLLFGLVVKGKTAE